MSPGRRSIVPVVLLFTVFLTLEGSLETWGSWGSCSNSCGSGSQSRSRACNNTAPLTGGTNCSVTLSETQSCNVHACSSCSGNVQADIVFVMDASGSVGDVNFQTMKEFVRDQVDSFDIDANNIRVGVLKFSSTANTEFNLNDFLDKDAIKNNIMNINYTGGKTFTGDALSYMRTSMFTTANGDREGVNDIGVIITDGLSNNFTHTADQARAARNANITIFSIGIGSSNHVVNELSEIASKPDSDYLFTVANFSALSGIHTAYQAKACVPATPVFNNCGGHLSGQGGQIVSPNFPDYYPNNSVCSWTLTGLPGDNIRVSFSHLDLENSPDCHQDSLSFRNGTDRTASLLSRVCSAVLPSDITSTGNVMYVRFATDLESSGTGFNITWTAKCLETHTLWSGTIRTVNSSHECTFIVQQPQSYVIYLQFQNFHVGNDTVNCTTNYVEVRDGDEEGSPLLGRRYCGTDTPPLLTSSQNMTWIRYVTDGSDIAAGFYATYWRAEPCPTVVLTERNGTFTSPSYPSNYRNYMNCTWHITAETDNVIRLTFANFSLESDTLCRYDWVDILDGATSRGRYCGESGPGTLTSSSNRVTVTFKTDGSVTKPGFSASYVIYLSSDHPPECSSTQNNVSFPDSAAVGTCSTVTVQCSSNGPDTTLDVTNSTDGPVRWTISQGNMDTDSSLVFTVCVTDVLFHFIGQYEASLNVSNSTGVTSVTWSVTIDDVNQPPAFISASYNIQVSESTAVQTTIAQVPLVTSRAPADMTTNDVITVWDPDNVTTGFEFKGINVQSVNWTFPNSSQVTTTDQSSLPIYLRNDSGPPFFFLTRSPLSAGVKLAFTLQAEDEQGAVGSNTVVTFVVSDVNQAPVCASNNVYLTIALTKQVNDSVFTVTCRDLDVNSTLSSLTYLEYTTSDSDYDFFSITSGGEISLEQRLPLNVTTMTYTVYVIDGGGLVANVTLHLDINRSFPPTCPFPSRNYPSRNHMTLPETANVTQCDTLTIACSHRTELDHYGLTFNVAFVYNTSLFQVDHQKREQPPSYFNVTGCPNTDLLGHAGSYNLDFTVSSELGTFSSTLGIVVTDVNQPPQFDQDSYMFNLAELEPNGTTVAHVVVGSSTAVAGRNEIRVTDPDTKAAFVLDAVLETGVSLFHANGSQAALGKSPGIVYSASNFTVTGTLPPEQYYVFLLTARDRDGLSATATVTIAIFDVNEPPTCPSFFQTRANLTSSIGSAIFTINCVDNDVKAEYKNLTYTEIQHNAYDYFDVSQTGDVTLTSIFPADVNRLRYEVQARDGGFYTTGVTLFVDINRNFGPECTPSSQVDVSFPEDALSGACSQILVNCTDTSGRSLQMTVRVISDATQGDIRVNDNRGSNPSNVALEACVTAPSSRLMSVGQFEITVEVNNTLNVTQVTFNVTVTDINQRPFFSQSAYLTTVPEFVSGSTTTTIATVRSPSGSTPSRADVVDIVRDDPDTQANFAIASLQHSLRAEYTNGTAYEGSFTGSEPITMSGNNLVAVRSLRPDLVYFVKLTVTDGQGLSANTTLEIKVTDVNQPPSCPLKTEISLDLLEYVQTTVASVSCTDSDYNDTYRDMSYFSYPEADHAYFGVETSGDVKLVTSVPRDAIQLVLKAYAMDGGGLQDNTTLTFIIDHHPPECSSTQNNVSFPDSAAVGTCSIVTVQCSTNGPDTTVNVTNSTDGPVRWTISQGNMDTDSSLVFTVCVTDVLFHFIGQYEASLNVSNSTGVTSVTWSVTIDDVNQPPAFLSASYNIQVSESTAVQTTIAQVPLVTSRASADTTTNDVIPAWDPDNVTAGFEFKGINVQSVNVTYPNSSQVTTTDQSSLPVYLRNDSGTPFSFLTRYPLSAGVQLAFTLQAEDAQGSVSRNTVVTFVVFDVNQAPVCANDNFNLTIDLIKQVNDSIYTVSCTDNDVNSTLSSLTYHEYTTPDSDYDYFSISPRGEISLEQRLPLNVTTMTYKVYVIDGGGLVANVTLHLDINRNFGPECAPSSQIDVSFPEDARAGECSQTQVTCTGSSGRSLPMTVRLISDPTQGEINVTDNRGVSSSTVDMKACVAPRNSSLMTFGQFEITVEVNNTLNVTQVTFNITVNDVNQPPSFAKPSYVTTVPESVAGSSNSTIAVVRSLSESPPSIPDVVDIVRDDPDTQDKFDIVSIQYVLRAEYTNRTSYEGDFNATGPITMVGNSVVRIDSLRPDLVYFVNITVKDGQGLSDNTTLQVKVTDVNEPPSCPLKPNKSLDLLESAQTVVASVSCTDFDYNDTFRNLSYFSYQEADHGYFDVETSGDVRLVTSVPRDAIQLVLKVYAMDGGGLEDNTTLTFIIDRNYPPDCFPSYVPPDGVWEFDKCFRVYPNCSDPTTHGDKRFLTYTFTGSWQNGFRQTVQVNDTYDYAEFCYNLRSDGNFTIHLAASNVLGNHTWEQDVVVTYKVASPKFTSNRYNAVSVNETAAVGFLVETVQALVDGQSVPLVYTFTGAGMFEQFFTIDSNTGNITVLKDLSPLAETEQKTYVMATDPATNLTHSVPVTVKVNDVNQPPTCSPAVFDVTVLWNVTINDVIAIVNCTDLDPRNAFSQLSYNLDTAGSIMWRSDQAAVKLRSRALLEPLLSQYIVHVLATDTTFTATTTVTINIDRTPPDPVPSVSSVTTSTVNIDWTFDQQYVPVICNFTIAIRNSSNSNTIRQIFVVSKNSLSYVIPGLNPEQTYGVVVTANGFDANVTSVEISFTTQPKPILTQVSAEIKLTNETWSRDLLDNTSVSFIYLSNTIESVVHNRLGSVLGYVSTKVRSFRAGSVYADIGVTSNQFLLNTSDLETELFSLVSSGSVGSMPVNSSYLQFYNGAYYIADMSLDYTSKGKVSNSSPGVHIIVTGYDVTATCSSRTPGVSEPKFDWTLGGRDMTTMQSSMRYAISLPNRSDNDPFKFVSAVRIKEILTTESGQLVCNVTAAGNTISKQVVLQVVRKLETILNPSSSIVSRASDVNLVCVRRAGYEVPWQAILYPAESAGGQVQDVVVNKTEKDDQANFTIRGVSSTVRYRCNISDSIATAVSNEATIFISEPATRNCLEDEDWAETPGGNTAHLSCPQGYADGGLQYRQCGTNGQWREPDTSQCVRQELEDLKTTIDQIGTGKTNATTKDVVEKLQNSTGGSRPLLSGDVTAAIDILDKVANFTVDTKQAPGEGELETFVMIADNVLHASSDVWQDQTTKALSLVNAVDRMGKASSRTLNSSGSQRPITSNKIVLQVGRSDRNDIMFPTPSQAQNYPEWVTAANNSAFLSKDAIGPGIDEVGYSAVIYRNLSNVFSGQVNQTLTGLSELSINSPILALSLALDGDRLLKPVRLTFDHIMVNFSSASCQFLDFSASAKGIWSTKGCWVTTSNSNMTVCECDHLTNFAVLMSPYRPANEVANVLNVFSIVGCSISIFCLILTLAIYFILWRYVKSDRSVLLVHMCVVLVLAYVTFLAGVNRVENEIVCTVVAGLLHYLWLVVFFLMLCEGIDIFITIVIIFPTKSALAWLLLTAYGVPVIIVGVSMGVTKSQGYGGTVFCWLSLEEGLFWAFVGPAVTALVANFVVIVIVIYTLLNSRVMIKKDKRERAKSVVKAICVMTPILGLSWIFGVMSVNDDTVVFQVLFVVFNSLQGLMIFILHCLLSKQVREGMQHKLRRYQTNSKGVDDSSSKYVTQKQTSESNMSSNDLDQKTISPFLQVDRQVQQMASKLSMLDNSKVMALRNPVAGITRAPPVQEPPINIQMNESTMGGRDDQQRRLYYVYGADTRISDYNIMGGAYARSRGGRFSLSAPYIGITPALRNPVYHDAVPALSSGYRWVRVTQSTKPQQHQRRGQQHPPVRHPSGPSPFQQPHPSSFYRLAASADNVGSSAENVGSSYYQPFATPKQIHKRHGNTRQPTQVDAKPSMLYHEPPVDYQ